MYSYIPLVYCIITYESLERALVAPPGGALWSHRCSRSVQLWTELCEDQICQLQSQMNALQLNTVWINTFPQTRTHRLEAVFPHSAGRETHPLIRSRRGSTGTVDGMQRTERPLPALCVMLDPQSKFQDFWQRAPGLQQTCLSEVRKHFGLFVFCFFNLLNICIHVWRRLNVGYVSAYL